MTKPLAFRLPRLKLVWDDPAADTSPVPSTEAPETDGKTDGDVPVGDRKPRKIKAPRPRRPIWLRLVAIGPGGLLNLILWCVLAGVVMRFTGLSPWSPPHTATETATSMSSQILNGLGWAIRTGWKPALTGATVIIPLWLGWRIITLPFRR